MATARCRSAGVTPSDLRRRFAPLPVAQHRERVASPADGPLDIAIIGLAGRYPMADNIEEFWTNLKDGRDCITEIPQERWNHDPYFDKDRHKPGKTYSKWGGFLNGVDCFDPLFFNISPREAEMMDPQERLFLECVYEAIEDAGYTRASLAASASPRYPGAPAPVGVYVGVMYEEYQLYGAQEQAKGRPVVLLGSPSSIANRVSYFFNFNGPSMAVDTMCSSSLTAIHLACESLKRGECQLAIAGGVNISIHPNKYLRPGPGSLRLQQGPLRKLWRRRRRLRPRRGRRSRAAQTAGCRPSRTATRFMGSSRAAPSTTAARPTGTPSPTRMPRPMPSARPSRGPALTPGC